MVNKKKFLDLDCHSLHCNSFRLAIKETKQKKKIERKRKEKEKNPWQWTLGNLCFLLFYLFILLLIFPQIQGGKGDVTITNDGATILKEMQVLHPAAKMVGYKRCLSLVSV